MAILALLVGLVYANTLTVPFVFDDEGAVLLNPTIRDLGSLDVLRPAADGSTTTARPLVNLSLALNYALSGEATWSYHLVNLLIHLGCTLLLFGLVRRTVATGTLLHLPRRSEAGGPPAVHSDSAGRIALATAALWAVHPLQTETVVTIAQRTESLCAFFYLLTLYGFVRGVRNAAVHQPAINRQVASDGGLKDRPIAKPGARWLAVSAVACLAGMASKEVMVTAPLVVLLFDRTFVAGSFAAAWRRRRGYYLGLAATWVLLAGLVFSAGSARGDAAGLGQGVSAWHYLLTQAGALLHYLRLSLWPYPLVLDYGTAVTRNLADAIVAASAVLLGLAGTVWALVRRPVAGFLAASFFVLLAPSSSFIPLVTQTVAEHRMYLPLALLVVSATWATSRVRGGFGALGILGVALGAATLARNADYRDPIRLWQENAVHAPRVPRVFNNLAIALQRAGRSDEAARAYARAVELDPTYVSAYYSWGLTLLERGDPAGAIERLSRAVALSPNHIDARFSLATALVRAGRGAEAVPHFEALRQRQPSADVHHNLALALAADGRVEEATREFEAAIELDPAQLASRLELARLLQGAGRAAAARAVLEDLLKVDGRHREALQRVAMLCAQAGDLGTAERHFRALVEVAPGDAAAHGNLGNVLLLRGQPEAAMRSYERALALRPGDPRLQESLELAREALGSGR